MTIKKPTQYGLCFGYSDPTYLFWFMSFKSSLRNFMAKTIAKYTDPTYMYLPTFSRNFQTSVWAFILISRTKIWNQSLSKHVWRQSVCGRSNLLPYDNYNVCIKNIRIWLNVNVPNMCITKACILQAPTVLTKGKWI